MTDENPRWVDLFGIGPRLPGRARRLGRLCRRPRDRRKGDPMTTWAERKMRDPKFRVMYYRVLYSDPWPLRFGREYHRRQKRRRG